MAFFHHRMELPGRSRLRDYASIEMLPWRLWRLFFCLQFRERLLGSVAVSTRAALLRQIAPREARDAGNGRSLAKSRNDAWRNLPRNPKGRASFCVVRRYSTAHLGDQTSRLAPSPTQKLAPSRPCAKRQQTLSQQAAVEDKGLSLLRTMLQQVLWPPHLRIILLAGITDPTLRLHPFQPPAQGGVLHRLA